MRAGAGTWTGSWLGVAMAGSLQLLAPQSLKIGLAYAEAPPAALEVTACVDRVEPCGHADLGCELHVADVESDPL